MPVLLFPLIFGVVGFVSGKAIKEAETKVLNYAIIGAEYVLNILPRGTHEYAKFIKPAELARMARNAGLSSKEIGENLFISNRTAETHRSNIMKKLDVHNTAGLIKLAYQAELL